MPVTAATTCLPTLIATVLINSTKHKLSENFFHTQQVIVKREVSKNHWRCKSPAVKVKKIQPAGFKVIWIIEDGERGVKWPVCPTFYYRHTLQKWGLLLCLFYYIVNIVNIKTLSFNFFSKTPQCSFNMPRKTRVRRLLLFPTCLMKIYRRRISINGQQMILQSHRIYLLWWNEVDYSVFLKVYPFLGLKVIRRIRQPHVSSSSTSQMWHEAMYLLQWDSCHREKEKTHLV